MKLSAFSICLWRCSSFCSWSSILHYIYSTPLSTVIQNSLADHHWQYSHFVNTLSRWFFWQYHATWKHYIQCLPRCLLISTLSICIKLVFHWNSWSPEVLLFIYLILSHSCWLLAIEVLSLKKYDYLNITLLLNHVS